MCRAVWVVLVAPEGEQDALRRAVGAEAEVVGAASSPSEALALAERADVLVVHEGIEAKEMIATLRNELPGAAVVWVGDGAPAEADASVPSGASLGESLPGAVAMAMISSRRRRS